MNISSVKAPVIEARFTHQAHRIAEGVKSGSLTKAEAKELVGQQKALYKDLYEAKTNDGYVSRQERSELRQGLREASRDIFEAKHNSEVR
jgi:hypothetical protein